MRASRRFVPESNPRRRKDPYTAEVLAIKCCKCGAAISARCWDLRGKYLPQKERAMPHDERVFSGDWADAQQWHNEQRETDPKHDASNCWHCCYTCRPDLVDDDLPGNPHAPEAVARSGQ